MGFAVYVVGVPVVLWHIVVKLRERLLSRGALPEWYSASFGFISLKYKPSVYWWELVVMSRKALMVVAFTVWSRSIAGMCVSVCWCLY